MKKSKEKKIVSKNTINIQGYSIDNVEEKHVVCAGVIIHNRSTYYPNLRKGMLQVSVNKRMSEKEIQKTNAVYSEIKEDGTFLYFKRSK